MCSKAEQRTILNAIYEQDKALFAKWVSEHKDLSTPPIEAEPKEPKTKLKEDELNSLKDLSLDLIKVKTDGELGASLIDVIKDLCDLGYDREDIDNTIGSLLDKGSIYEPFTGKLMVVNI